MARGASSRADVRQPAGPGIALRELRRVNNWTLLDLSAKTGIAVSTLSRIENGVVSPTFDVLTKLSRGLQIDLADLVSGETRPASAPQLPTHAAQVGRRSVNRLGDGQLIDLSHHSLLYLSTDLLNKQITPIIGEYRARTRAEFGEFMRHDGEEYLYVLEGVLELHTECYAPVVLKAGESIYFDSRMGHAYIARELPCRALSICTGGDDEMPASVSEGADSVERPNEPAPSMMTVLPGNASSRKRGRS
jgi:transcriptional regulator with XRE-family HTH domain